MPKELNTCDILYVRHAKSESNRDDDAGVHIYDPLLLSGDEDKIPDEHAEAGKGYGYGRSYCEKVQRQEIGRRTPLTHIAVSPSSRCVQTMMLTVPLDMLKAAKITVLPIIIEQTEWMSDRMRYVRQIRMLVEQELRARVEKEGKLASQLNINYNLLVAEDSSLETSRKEFVRFESRLGLGVKEQQDLERRINDDKLGRPWQTKTGLYAAARAEERGSEALKTLALWAETAKDYAKDGVELQFAVFGHGGLINFMQETLGDVRPEPGRLSAWNYGEIRELRLKWTTEHGNISTEKLKWVKDNCVESSSEEEKDKVKRLLEYITKVAGSDIRQDLSYGGKYREADDSGKNPTDIFGLNDEYLLERIPKSVA